MFLSPEMLAAEAERLVSRAEQEVHRYRAAADASELAHRAELELKRLQLYRAVVKSVNSAHVFMPEYVAARGLIENG